MRNTETRMHAVLCVIVLFAYGSIFITGSSASWINGDSSEIRQSHFSSTLDDLNDVIRPTYDSMFPQNGDLHSDGDGDHTESRRRQLKESSRDSDGPSLTIFCAPKPYVKQSTGIDSQRRALYSWLRLAGRPKIVLIGNHSSFWYLASQYPTRIRVEPLIDTNFYSVPLFHSIVARAQVAKTDLSMIINGDIVLLNDAILAIEKVHSSFSHWVLTAARWDVSADFPYTFEPSMWESGKGKSTASIEKEVREKVREQGSLHTYGGVDLWVWNNNSPEPLIEGAMPPFAFGRGKYDNWMTHEMIVAHKRAIVDVSDAMTAIHVAHTYDHVVTGKESEEGARRSLVEKTLAPKNFWSTRKKSSWELFANIHMAMTHGSYTNQKGTALHTPFKLAACLEPSAHYMCFQKRPRPAICTCEYSSFVRASQSDPKLDVTRTRWICGTISVDRRKEYQISAVPGPDPTPGLPHLMEQLLPQVARTVVEGGKELKVVTLVAVTIGYASMLMSFICRLRTLGLADNLVVAALDEDLYRFAFTQGLAVYYEQVSLGLKNIDSADCTFGSQCFRKFTKLKSRAVLRVLKAGYSVLWTDVDIVWYSDPLPDLMSWGPGTFPIQSNEPNASIPGCGIRRINSGFYFARADAQTVEAFEAITAHAATTKLSEQPSFYDTLCGVKGERLVEGKEECEWQNGLRTIFLSRAKYPNGAVYSIWDADDPTVKCEELGCKILHNNWIAGKEAKQERFTKNGYWHYDDERRMCIWPWHKRLPPLYLPSKE